MKKTIIMKRKNEFKLLFSKGRFYYGNNVVMYFLKNKKKYNKLGIAVSKKCGKAVERNKIKRLIKENYREIEACLNCGFNIVVSVNKKCDLKNVNFYDVKNDMEKILKKSEIWIDKNEKNCVEIN